ncbi:TrkA family potassium uptake protein (plasmid) [Paraclostridium ghonii]|uniref:potassium channel family protein n=1 Tax=Paraclostridium ghonii TaxID=29358 RepID=UPI00202CB532|nr:TrkA family potassium uptake protein [Paeniclostridium ghonii]MCM0165076.1 TrkA family potassium uptake protein [Paeniclostridium ghonii]
MKRKKNNYVIVAGCSRFGVNIATMLSLKGKDVVIIDINENSFRKIPPSYSGYKIQGDATDIEVLKDSGIEKASMIVVATDDDNVNIMIAQIADEIFKVESIVSRLYDTEKEIVYNDLNIKIIRPVKLTIEEFENITCEDDILSES